MQRKTRTKGQIVSLLIKISLFDVFSQLQTPSTKQSTWKSKYVGTRYRLYFKLGDGGRLILTDFGSKTEIERAWIVHETWNNHRNNILLLFAQTYVANYNFENFSLLRGPESFKKWLHNIFSESSLDYRNGL